MEELIAFLKQQRDTFAYEQTAMSEASFSRFLDDLVKVIDLRLDDPEGETES